jgi:hypothetical protein
MKPSPPRELEARRSSFGCSPVGHAATGASWNTTPGGGAESQISQALIQAYLGTAYSAQTAVGGITLKIGVRSDEIVMLLASSGADCAAFITAENPFSEPQTPAANAERQRRLGNELTALGLTYFPGKGQGEDPSWPAEASFLVLGMGRAVASDVGRKYGQNAVVWIAADGVPELVLLS